MNQKLHSWVFIPEKRLCSHKKLYLSILMSFKGCTAELWDTHSREYSSVTKRNELFIHNLDESQKKYAKWKEPILKGYLLHNSIHITSNDKSQRWRTGKHHQEIEMQGRRKRRDCGYKRAVREIPVDRALLCHDCGGHSRVNLCDRTLTERQRKTGEIWVIQRNVPRSTSGLWHSTTRDAATGNDRVTATQALSLLTTACGSMIISE